MNAESLPRALQGIVGGDFSDPTNERIIYLSALGLAIVGLALLVSTILWWRRGRQEHPALAPLEVMSRRSWFKAPEGDRRRRLDHVRLAGSEAGAVEVVRAEPVDLEALVRSMPQAFDDLREPGEEPVVAEVEHSAVAAEGGLAESIVAEPVDAEMIEPEVESNEPVSEPDVATESSKDVPVVAEADATAVAIEQPAAVTDPSVEALKPAVGTPDAPVEVLATGSNESLE